MVRDREDLKSRHSIYLTKKDNKFQVPLKNPSSGKLVFDNFSQVDKIIAFVFPVNWN